MRTWEKRARATCISQKPYKRYFDEHQVALQVAAAAPQVLVVLDDLQRQLDQEEDDATCASARIFREALVLARRRIQAGQSQKGWMNDFYLPFLLSPSFEDAEEVEKGQTQKEVDPTEESCINSALLRRFCAHNPVGFSSTSAAITPSSVHVAIGCVVPHALTGGSDPVQVVVAEAVVRKLG